MLQKRSPEFPVSEGITTNLEDPVYDFRWSEQGEVLTVTTDEGVSTLVKNISASALEGWVLDGEMPVRLVVLDPPHRREGAVLYSRLDELAVIRLEGQDANKLHSLGRNPDISLRMPAKEGSAT